MIAFLLGTGVASAVLHYDGTFPVNVVTAFASLVLVQVLLVVATVALLLASRFGVSWLQDALAAVHPATIAAAIYRRLAAPAPRLAALFSWHHSRSAAGRFARWQLVAWSQAAAIAFNLGVLASALALVTFTDLAFGWTTTLRLDCTGRRAHRARAGGPWAGPVPDAVPSRELIAQSQYFRLEHNLLEQRQGAAYTAWWPFLLLSILCYGLLPRCVLWLLCRVRLAASTRALLLEDAGVSALLDRMRSPALELGAADAEPGGADPGALRSAPGAADRGRALAISWSGAVDAAAAGAAARTLGFALSQATARRRWAIPAGRRARRRTPWPRSPATAADLRARL